MPTIHTHTHTYTHTWSSVVVPYTANFTLRSLAVQFPNPEGGKDIDVRRLLLNKCQEEFERGTQVRLKLL